MSAKLVHYGDEDDDVTDDLTSPTDQLPRAWPPVTESRLSVPSVPPLTRVVGPQLPRQQQPRTTPPAAHSTPTGLGSSGSFVAPSAVVRPLGSGAGSSGHTSLRPQTASVRPATTIPSPVRLGSASPHLQTTKPASPAPALATTGETATKPSPLLSSTDVDRSREGREDAESERSGLSDLLLGSQTEEDPDSVYSGSDDQEKEEELLRSPRARHQSMFSGSDDDEESSRHSTAERDGKASARPEREKEKSGKMSEEERRRSATEALRSQLQKITNPTYTSAVSGSPQLPGGVDGRPISRTQTMTSLVSYQPEEMADDSDSGEDRPGSAPGGGARGGGRESVPLPGAGDMELSSGEEGLDAKYDVTMAEEDGSQRRIAPAAEEPPDPRLIIPPAPKRKCAPDLQKMIAGRLRRKLERGEDFNEGIQGSMDFRNPSFYEKLLEYMGIDEKGSNFPPEMYDRDWGKESFYEELARAQKAEIDKREREKKERTKVEFVTGTRKSSGELEKKKSKWEPQAQPKAIVPPSNIIPVGVIQGAQLIQTHSSQPPLHMSQTVTDKKDKKS